MLHRRDADQLLLIHVTDDPGEPARITHGPVDGTARATELCATDDKVLDVVRRWLTESRSP